MKTQTKFRLGAFVAVLVTIIGIQTHLLVLASEIEVEKPAPVCTSIECAVERRTLVKYEQNHDINMESARLQVLLDINSEMQGMTLDKSKRLDN